jgi:hypothetical protein
MEVLRKMFPDRYVPDATDILVPRWWSDKFFRGSITNWPIGMNRYEYVLLRYIQWPLSLIDASLVFVFEILAN